MKIKIGNKSFELTKEQIEKGEFIIEDVIVRTTDEENKFLNNIKAETSKAAIEIGVKKLRNDLKLEFEGKTIENLVEALTEKHKAEFTKEPSKILEEKEKDLKTLKEKVIQLEAKKKEIEGNHNSFKNNIRLEKELFSVLPKDLAIPQEDMLMIIKSKLNPTVDGDKVVFKKGDEILKDSSTLDPLDSKRVISDFFAENKHYLKPLNGGGGGQDDPGQSNPKSLEAWEKRYEAAGGSADVSAKNQALMKAITNKEVEI
jgi:hypothetical protein